MTIFSRSGDISWQLVFTQKIYIWLLCKLWATIQSYFKIKHSSKAFGIQTSTTRKSKYLAVKCKQFLKLFILSQFTHTAHFLCLIVIKNGAVIEGRKGFWFGMTRSQICFVFCKHVLFTFYYTTLQLFLVGSFRCKLLVRFTTKGLSEIVLSLPGQYNLQM